MMFERFCEEKALSKSTMLSYKSCVALYENIIGMDFDKALKKADEEEEEGIRWKHSSLRQYLINFRKYMFQHKSEGTAKKYVSIIKSLYSYFEISIGKLPTFQSKQIDTTYELRYEDLLTHEELVDAYYEANNVGKCIITFAISSGLAKVDILNLTVGDFMKACEKYTTSNDLMDSLMELKNQKEIIGVFDGERQKTNSRFITFCSPEASSHIVQYLIGRNLHHELSCDDKLFDVSSNHLSKSFHNINQKLQLGKAGKFTRFRCHMLRKFHASTLINSEIMQWTVDEIDTLQGRVADVTHRAYIQNSKEKLFKKYHACVDELMLFQKIHGVDMDQYDEMKKENDFYKNEIVKNEQKMEEQKRTIDEIIKNQRELEAMLGL